MHQGSNLRRTLVLYLLPALCGLVLASAQPRTVWDGVYTDAQAERGGMAYQQACVACHREDLRGDNTAPSLVGESFTFLWGDMEVGELSARIQKLMPPERPGSLPPQTYSDIIAFILKKNAFPAGTTELGADPAALHIPIIATKPKK
ncbi:MAG TPA: cytochrome c [Vicinamibacterales bacterium]|nr:cytochrome c [Vicinamibacterales bacterium]